MLQVPGASQSLSFTLHAQLEIIDLARLIIILGCYDFLVEDVDQIDVP